MTDPTEPKNDDELPADETSGAGYGNNAEEPAPGGNGGEEQPDER